MSKYVNCKYWLQFIFCLHRFFFIFIFFFIWDLLKTCIMLLSHFLGKSSINDYLKYSHLKWVTKQPNMPPLWKSGNWLSQDNSCKYCLHSKTLMMKGNHTSSSLPIVVSPVANVWDYSIWVSFNLICNWMDC